MKIALAQINPIVGDLHGNAKKIEAAIVQARKKKARLLIFSELSLWGYPPRDLLLDAIYYQQQETLLNQLAKNCEGICALVGGVFFDKATNQLANAAFRLEDGKITQVFTKRCLPFYDVFDEPRYFYPFIKSPFLKIDNHQFLVTICEDIWVMANPSLGNHYPSSPLDELTNQKVDAVINLSASPFDVTKKSKRLALFEKVVAKTKSPLFFVNQVGANDELIFDGGSCVISQSGKILHQLNDFVADFECFEFDHQLISSSKEKALFSLVQESSSQKNFAQLWQALKLGVRDYFNKSGFQKVVLGLSGGIDSALVAVLASQALSNKNVTALFMPSRYSSAISQEDAASLAHHLDISFNEMGIHQLHDQLETQLTSLFGNKLNDLTAQNIQARLRGLLLMAYANQNSALVLATSNKSELAMGFSTLYGDLCGALCPLGDLLKTEVYELARWINRNQTIIPERIITRAPTAELKANQTDQDTLPDYALLDETIHKRMVLRDFSGLSLKKQSKQKEGYSFTSSFHNAEYKRWQAPVILKVSPQAFGMGWRYPLASKKLD